MILYANHLTFVGSDSAVFEAVGDWLKEKLGYRLNAADLRVTGDHKGYSQKDSVRTRVRIRKCESRGPHESTLSAWELTHPHRQMSHQQWKVEIGLKKSGTRVDISCVMTVRVTSVLVRPRHVSVNMPRVIRYVIQNVDSRPTGGFPHDVPGTRLRMLGNDSGQVEAVREAFADRDRKHAIVIMSPTGSRALPCRTRSGPAGSIRSRRNDSVTPGYSADRVSAAVGLAEVARAGGVTIIGPAAGGEKQCIQPNDLQGLQRITQVERILAHITTTTNAGMLQRHISLETVIETALLRASKPHQRVSGPTG